MAVPRREAKSRASRRVLSAFRLAFILLLALAQSARAQTPPEPAILVADTIAIGQGRTLEARGNVEIFQADVRLTATAVLYDPETGALRLEGPLRLQEGGRVTILASAAELNRDLRNGILRSARMVLDQQLQLAAVQINRVDARYSQLYKAVVTSCRVCNDGRPPLWQIRARRVVHDQQARQLYFEGAQFRLGNVPILYLPRLRLPDPTLERATGFLIPSIYTTSQLGTGLKVPYFIRLGRSRDLTLAPYLSPETTTLELRYRQAFRTGRIYFEGAISDDTLRPGEERYYLFGGGSFDLPRDFRLDFHVEVTSDDAYLVQYDYSDKDRLDSEIAVSRARRDEFVRAGLIGYQSLREDEDNSTLPTIVADVLYERRFFPEAFGGELRLNLAGHSHYRSSDDPLDGAGRDVMRLHADLRWLRGWTLPGGLRVEGQTGLGFDFFDTRQDVVFAGRETRSNANAAIALRYPLTRTSAQGAVHLLEPVVQLAYVALGDANVANDESTLVEFDEGNLLALSRFPEVDRREDGAALTVGLNWARFDPRGIESFLSFGQIYRKDPIDDFSRASGLQGQASDILIAGQLRTQAGLALGGRFLFNDEFDFSKAEVRGDWRGETLTLGGSYLWLVEDPAEYRDRSISELTLDGAYRVSRHWTLSGKWRYDVEDDRTARAGFGLGYDNECVRVALSVERRFTATRTVEPSTNFGFTIALRGFSASNGTESYTRSCKSSAS